MSQNQGESWGFHVRKTTYRSIGHLPDPWQHNIVSLRRWMLSVGGQCGSEFVSSSQQIIPLSGGGSRYRMKLSALEEIERWILSWGTHATVLQPETLATRITTISRELARRYAEPSAPIST